MISHSCSGSLTMPCVQPMSRTDISYLHPVENQHLFCSCSTRKTQKLATNRLTIASYKCKNTKTSTLEICDLMRHANIILLQEHWLYQCQLYQIGEIHNDLCHVGNGVDKYDEIDQSKLPRGYGGVGICWHKDLDQFVGMVEEGNERIQCIEVNQISNKPILIICVYMPTSGGSEKTIEYPETVDLLNELLQRYYNTHYIVIRGDINEDLSSKAVNSRKKYILDFIDENSLIFTMDRKSFPIILLENPVKKKSGKELSIKQLILNGKHNSWKQRNYIKIFNT